MKAQQIVVHNFRSLKHAVVVLHDYSLLVGENNTGKTSILTALRCFYEQGGAHFSRDVDFPKFPTQDRESWIEIHFLTTEEEQEGLKEEYRSRDNLLRVRRYFASENKDLVKANQSNIYGYEGGVVSQSLFYGAKNISQAKLGRVIYIPEVNKTDDTLKLSGPSPFRDMVNFLMKRAVGESKSFTELQDAFERFNAGFKEEESKDGFSIGSFIEEINRHIAHWRIRFGIDTNALRPEDIIKTLLTHYIEDQNLPGKRVNIGAFGQGLQRHVIYTMIWLTTRFVAPRPERKKKEFAPDYTLLLFEEPEAFLHPSQQNRLNASLSSLSDEEGQQVLITTHSPRFVSKQIQDATSIIRVFKPAEQTAVHRLSEKDMHAILDENLGLYRRFSDMLDDPAVPGPMKKAIKSKRLGGTSADTDKKLDEEAIRYILWLNSERAALFFAGHVVICEGPTEKVLFETLIDQRWPDLRHRDLCFVDAMGKFAVHRFVTLLSALGIPHSILIDRDSDVGVHKVVNDFISEKKTALTVGMYSFDRDVEHFLGIEEAPRRDLKPVHVLAKLRANEIAEDRLDALRELLLHLISSSLPNDGVAAEVLLP